MTREQQINEAAVRYCLMGGIGDLFDTMAGFKDGAKWADSHPHWIPVEEELPKKDGKYLFYDEVLGHEVSIYYDGVILVPSITHWMPLPEAPRKEE